MEMIEEDGNVSGEDFCIFKFFPSSIYLELCFLLDFPSLRNLMNTCKLLNHKIKTVSFFFKIQKKDLKIFFSSQIQ